MKASRILVLKNNNMIKKPVWLLGRFFCHLYRDFMEVIYCFCFYFVKFIKHDKICTMVELQIVCMNYLDMLIFWILMESWKK